MIWFYGFDFKCRFVKRITEELGVYNGHILAMDMVVERYLRDLTNVSFHMRSDYQQRIILTFHQSRNKDLSGLRTSMVMMKVIGMLLYGDKNEEREPSWFTDDPHDAPGEEEDPSDDDLDLLIVPGWNEDIISSQNNESSSSGVQRSFPGAGNARPISIRNVRVRRRKMRIVSAGRLRKTRRVAA